MHSFLLVWIHTSILLPAATPSFVLESASASITEAAEKVTPAVVNITTRRVRSTSALPNEKFLRDLLGPKQRQFAPEIGAGSGVVISADGFIVTNHHVIENADDIRVSFADKREYSAELIGTDKPSDIALLKINAPKLAKANFGSSDKLRLGDIVLAIGNPFGIGQTVTMGIVSAKGRAKMGIVDYEDFIQTDASINPGNSGGALVNLSGELVGINTAIITKSGGTQGIGFAVPSAMVQPILDEIMEFGRVRRSWVGLAIQDLTPEIARVLKFAGNGVVVSDVMDNSPASRSNLEAGDIITQVNGQGVSTASELRNRIALMRPNTQVIVNLLRSQKPVEVTLRLTEKDPEPRIVAKEKPVEQALLTGLAIRDLSPKSRQELQLRPDETGVWVTGVEPGTPSDRSGLEQDDVIVSVDAQPVHSAIELTRRVRPNSPDAVFRVIRHGISTFMVLKR